MDCKQNYRGKKQREVAVYVCTGYNNNSSNCERFAIKEQEIFEVVKRHFEIRNRFGDQFISNPIDRVDRVEVYTKDKTYMVYYKDEKECSIMSEERIRY